MDAQFRDYIMTKCNHFCNNCVPVLNLSNKFHFPFIRLAEVGKLSLPLKSQEKYETGQLFLHRVFGYRGVILFPWRAKVYDRNSYVPTTDSTDKPTPSTPTSEVDDTVNKSDISQNEMKINKDGDTVSHTDADEDEQSGGITDAESMTARRVGSKEISVNVQTYYQVLIDSRDCPHVVCQQSDIVQLTFMNVY